MKATKKEVTMAKKQAEKIENSKKTDRIKTIEELVILMDERMTGLENQVDEMMDIFERIRARMGI